MKRSSATADAVQAEAAVRLEEAVRARQAEAGVPARKLGEGVASQIALARRVSPEKGAKLLGLAKILINEMPHRPGPDGSIITITPTGHTYISPPPDTWQPDPPPLSPAELKLRRVLRDHTLAA